MSERVDKNTLLCKAHNAPGCTGCMVEDFYDWIAEQARRRAQLKRERDAATVDEKFDLGGES